MIKLASIKGLTRKSLLWNRKKRWSLELLATLAVSRIAARLSMNS